MKVELPSGARRGIPVPPQPNEPIKLIIDTDAANEVDDLYAMALAIACPQQFEILGFVATHFAAREGYASIRKSYDVIKETLEAGNHTNTVVLGGDPMGYPKVPQLSEGADFIIETALKAEPDDRLLILALGAASNVASALLLRPEIADRIVVMFHGRSEETWPLRTTQFNIYGDVLATQHLLESNVPLIWFDTGTKLCASMEETNARLKPLGRLGRFLHDYREREPLFQSDDKGFFDLGDVAWLIDPQLCTTRVVPAPALTRWLYFDHEVENGEMLHVSDIRVDETWQLFYQRLGHAV